MLGKLLAVVQRQGLPQGLGCGRILFAAAWRTVAACKLGTLASNKYPDFRSTRVTAPPRRLAPTIVSPSQSPKRLRRSTTRRRGVPRYSRWQGAAPGFPGLAAFAPDVANDAASVPPRPPRHESRCKSSGAKSAAEDRSENRYAHVLDLVGGPPPTQPPSDILTHIRSIHLGHPRPLTPASLGFPLGRPPPSNRCGCGYVAVRGNRALVAAQSLGDSSLRFSVPVHVGYDFTLRAVGPRASRLRPHRRLRGRTAAVAE